MLIDSDWNKVINKITFYNASLYLFVYKNLSINTPKTPPSKQSQSGLNTYWVFWIQKVPHLLTGIGSNRKNWENKGKVWYTHRDAWLQADQKIFSCEKYAYGSSSM